MSRFVLLSFLFVLFIQVFADNVKPGLKLRVTDKGLNYGAEVAVDILTGKVVGQAIPAVSGTAHVTVGKVEYELKNMNIRSFGKPASSVSTQTQQGITWSARGASASLHGDWHYKYRLSFIEISDGGSFDVSVSGVNFQLTVILGKTTQNKPSISASGCSAEVGHVDVTFHGGASWLYNLFSDYAADAIKDKLRDIMCKAATDAVNNNANKTLSHLKVITNIGKTMDLDYSLVAKPSFTSTFMESYHKGEVFWHQSHTEAPIPPPDFQKDASVSSMLYVWMSDYTLNTLGYVAHKHNMLKYNLTAKDLPKSEHGVLNTTCTSFICIGSMIPQLKKIVPDASVEISMVTTKPPTLNIVPSVMEGKFQGNMVLNARMKNGSLKYLFTSATTVTFNLTATVKGEIITAHIPPKAFKFDMKVMKTAIGPINVPGLKFVVSTACNSFVIPRLNELGEKGLVIPNLDQVHFVNPKIVLQQNSIRISTDVKYLPETLYFKSSFP